MNNGKTQNDQPIKSFTDLNAWKEGHRLVLMIYKFTEHFPKSEVFGIVAQVRRSAVSLTSNIAEGFSRTSYRDKLQFYAIAQGSLTELQDQTIISKDIGYLTSAEFDECYSQSIIVHKLLNGLLKKTKSIIHDS